MRKIIVVDDDPGILDLVTEYLEQHNLKILTVSEGLKVVALAIKEEPDLIILDIDLPDIDGFQVLNKLKERPITAFIPVIMLTGNVSSDFQVTGLVSGADDYVTKPFDLNVLYARVLSALRHSLISTRQKQDQFNLLYFLIRSYSKRGYTCYTKLIQEYPAKPGNWIGYIPDLIIEKKDKIRCFNFETTQSLLEEPLLDRLTSMSDLAFSNSKYMESTIIVRTKDNYKIVDKIIKENGLKLTAKLIKRHMTKN
ncbi:MAG: response regulator transcription factor [Candidatus Marinimicrobia bacterium]|nr:response regulator transcription factor [Candidatus Neomarinimicrobiota bacterium]